MIYLIATRMYFSKKLRYQKQWEDNLHNGLKVFCLTSFNQFYFSLMSLIMGTNPPNQHSEHSSIPMLPLSTIIMKMMWTQIEQSLIHILPTPIGHSLPARPQWEYCRCQSYTKCICNIKLWTPKPKTCGCHRLYINKPWQDTAIGPIEAHNCWILKRC